MSTRTRHYHFYQTMPSDELITRGAWDGNKIQCAVFCATCALCQTSSILVSDNGTPGQPFLGAVGIHLNLLSDSFTPRVPQRAENPIAWVAFWQFVGTIAVGTKSKNVIFRARCCLSLHTIEIHCSLQSLTALTHTRCRIISLSTSCCS